ncbi:MAG: hypothetical protein ACRDBO_01150 [Lachnospiraceae bacterium]
MNAIHYIFEELTFAHVFFVLFISLFALKSVLETWYWLADKIGLQTRSVIKKNEHMHMLETHDITIDKLTDSQYAFEKDVQEINDKVGVLSQMLVQMQLKADASERARIKDRISQSYKYYHKQQHWTTMEKEAFVELIRSYENAEGVNSFIHTTCEPECFTWEVIDE